METIAPDRSEEFWQKAEEKHGTVLGFGMGQYSCIELDTIAVPTMPRKQGKIWGVCYVCSSGIFLYSFPQQHWLSSLFKQPEQPERWFEIFFTDVLQWREPLPHSFLGGLFGAKDERLLFATQVPSLRDANNAGGRLGPHHPNFSSSDSSSSSSTAQGQKSEDTEGTERYLLHSFVLDYRRELLLNLVRNFLHDTERII